MEQENIFLKENKENIKLVKVYHEIFSDFFENIKKEGLLPLSEQKTENAQTYKDRLSFELLIDEVRPKELIEKGISRLNVFAYPDNPKNTKSYFTDRGEKQTLLELLVDEQKCYILDMADYNSAFNFFKEEKEMVETGQIKEKDFVLKDRIKVWFSDYWKKAIPLALFLEKYKYNSQSDLYELKEKNEENKLPKEFVYPEVLIPEIIKPDKIKKV